MLVAGWRVADGGGSSSDQGGCGSQNRRCGSLLNCRAGRQNRRNLRRSNSIGCTHTPHKHTSSSIHRHSQTSRPLRTNTHHKRTSKPICILTMPHIPINTSNSTNITDRAEVQGREELIIRCCFCHIRVENCWCDGPCCGWSGRSGCWCGCCDWDAG